MISSQSRTLITTKKNKGGLEIEGQQMDVQSHYDEPKAHMKVSKSVSDLARAKRLEKTNNVRSVTNEMIGK